MSPKDNKKEPKQYSKFIVAFVILLNIIFTAVVLWIVYSISYEPTTLIISWFGFTTAELLALAGIRITEKKCECQQNYPVPHYPHTNYEEKTGGM